MTIYLEDGFPSHEKTIIAGPEAAWFYVCSLGYLKQQKSTDGTFPKHAIGAFGIDVKNKQRLAARLVEAELWHDLGDRYEVHNYVERNAKDIARRKQARDAAKARWHKPPQSERTSEQDADADADALQTHMQQGYRQTDKQPQPHATASASHPSSEPNGTVNGNGSSGRNGIDAPLDSGPFGLRIRSACEELAKRRLKAARQQGEDIKSPERFIKAMAADYFAAYEDDALTILGRNPNATFKELAGALEAEHAPIDIPAAWR